MQSKSLFLVYFFLFCLYNYNCKLDIKFLKICFKKIHQEFIDIRIKKN